MSRENGFWGKLKRKLGQDDWHKSLPNIEIPRIDMVRSEPVSSDVVSDVDAVFLRQQMSNHLDDDQLTKIGAKFGIDFVSLSGGKGRKVLDLVNQVQLQGALDQLLNYCQQMKPNVAWQLDK